MSGVLWHVTMSLDGFITGPDDAMAWAFGHGSSSLATEVMNETGAILAGRRWYEVATEVRRCRRDLRRRVGGPGVRPDPPPVGRRRGDAPGGPDRGGGGDGTRGGRRQGGGDLRRERRSQCLESGLLDEIVVHLAPVLLGDGVRLYGEPGSPMIELEMLSAHQAGQLTDLRFRCRSSPR